MNKATVIDMAATGANIRRLRAASGMSVRDLQALFEFATPQAIYKWQRGAALPTVDNLAILSYAFGVSIDDILVIREHARKSKIYGARVDR